MHCTELGDVYIVIRIPHLTNQAFQRQDLNPISSQRRVQVMPPPWARKSWQLWER